jgi:hypothetical protein
MSDILTIHLAVPVPAIKTIPRWKVFLALFDPRAHFTTCAELRHQLCRETEATARLQASQLFRNLTKSNHQVFSDLAQPSKRLTSSNASRGSRRRTRTGSCHAVAAAKPVFR